MLPRCLRAATMLGAAALLPCPSVLAQVHDKGNLPAPADRVDQTISGMLNRRPAAEMDDAELAGFAKGSRIEVLTWERAYTLALVAHREARLPRGGSLVDALDPEGLTVRADRHGVADFARFRKEFFEGIAGPGKAGGTFRDPSGDYFDLLKRIQAVDNARRDVSSFEDLMTVLKELEAASLALSSADLNRIEILLQQARLRESDEILRYRDQLDAFKIALGLSPHAPIAIDGGNLAAFRSAFEAVDRWSIDPNRSFADLPRLVDRLPAPGELMIGGRSLLDVPGEAPDPLEPLLSLGARVALENRAAGGEAPGAGEAAGLLELRVRHRIRHLLQTQRAYEAEKRFLVLAISVNDTAFERLIAPPLTPQGAEQRSLGGDIKDLIEQQSKTFLIRDRLVDLWASFRADRLALYRDLGAMPFDDWKSFYDQFIAKPGPPAPAKITPPLRPAPPAPAPPTSPAPPVPGR